MKKFGMFWMIVMAVGLFLPQAISAQKKSAKEIYTGNIFYLGGRTGTQATHFTLTIDTYTPSGDVEEYLATLKSGGQDALQKSISKDKRGTLQVGTQLARDINAAWITSDDEGKKITVLFERWVGFGEYRRGARSLDYQFTYLEIYIDAKGKGEGTLIPAARLRAKGKDTIEVENFAIYPARLTNIRLEK